MIPVIEHNPDELWSSCLFRYLDGAGLQIDGFEEEDSGAIEYYSDVMVDKSRAIRVRRLQSDRDELPFVDFSELSPELSISSLPEHSPQDFPEIISVDILAPHPDKPDTWGFDLEFRVGRDGSVDFHNLTGVPLSGCFLRYVEERPATAVGLFHDLLKYARDPDGSLEKRTRKLVEQRHAEVNQAISLGATTVKEIGERTGIPLPYIYSHFADLCKQLRKKRDEPGIRLEENQQRVRLIERGLSLTQLHDRFNISRQAVQNFIARYGLHETWLESRVHYRQAIARKKLERPELIGHIAGGLDSIVQQIMHTGFQNALLNASLIEGKAFQATQKCMRSSRLRTIQPTQLLKLFAIYYGLKETGETASSAWLGRHANIVACAVPRYLKLGGEQPFYTHTRHSPYNKEFLRDAFYIRMSGRDIAYFANLPDYTVLEYFRQHSKETGETRSGSVPRGGEWDRRFFSYRRASQIYEALDSGKNRSEVVHSLKASQKLFDQATRYRTQISEKIISALNVLHPDREFTKPYFTQD